MISLGSRSGETGFAEIYDAYYDRIYRYAYTLLLNRHDAEDVTADTFLAAYKGFSRYDEQKGSLGTWLTRIAHNTAVNRMRSSAGAKRADVPEDWDMSDEDADFADGVEAADAVLRLYTKLMPEERELLNMRYVMELRDREIAELLKLPEKTVNKRCQRLLAKCRTILSDGEML